MNRRMKSSAGLYENCYVPNFQTQGHNNSALFISSSTVHVPDTGSSIYKKRIFSPGSQIETFIDDRIGSVEGLAIDKETRVLYFTNIHLGENEWENSFFHYGTIEMIGLDTNSESNSETNSESRKIIHSSTRLPRAILVKNRQLLFTDWSSIKPIVYRFVL